MESETWRKIPDFGYNYEASSEGRIRSCDRPIKRKHPQTLKEVLFYYKGKILKQRPDKDGYLVVRIGFNNKKINLRVSRAVLLAFCGHPPTSKHFACHDDNDNTNNRPGNLRWGTHKDNMKDRLDAGNYKSGSSHCMSILTENQVVNIRLSNASTKQEALKHGVSYTTIWDIRNGRSWLHL